MTEPVARIGAALRIDRAGRTRRIYIDDLSPWRKSIALGIDVEGRNAVEIVAYFRSHEKAMKFLKVFE